MDISAAFVKKKKKEKNRRRWVKKMFQPVERN